jgi:phosphoglycolate phosphatase-like HAD superfamily hydrolase
MKILLFDIDGTLVNTDRSGKDAMIEAFLQVAKLDQLAAQIHVSGRTDRGIVHELFELHDREFTEPHWNHFCELYLAGLARNLPIRKGRILAGIEPLLAEVANRDDITLGLLTGNVQRGARIKLNHYQIDHYFPFGGFGDHHCERDDVARVARQAAVDHLQQEIPPSDIIGIGDTPNDILCARAIGAQAVAVATGVYNLDQLADHHADLLVEDLSDPAPFLAML